MSSSSLQGKYVLIIEDDASICETIEIALTLVAVNSHVVSNGAEALEFLAGTKTLPTLVLLDFRMPVMDGEAFRRCQLELPHLSSVPTILLSADINIEGLAARMGISEFLTKPFSLEQLSRVIKNYFPA